MPYSKEQLTPHGRRLFAAIKEKLPPEIANRLRSQTKFTTHGTRKTVYLFDIWHGSQNGVLPRNYFKYCLGCNPAKLGTAKTDGYFHLWLSTVRIYRKRESIKRYLERELPKVVPRGFTLDFVEERAISCGKNFGWPDDLGTLEEMILIDYVSLISAIHPILIEVIDRFSLEKSASSERRAEVKRRGRIAYARKGGALDKEKLRMYSRSIPPSWRKQILEKMNHRCQHCGTNLTKKKPHIDHIVPFSKGGDSILSNLQALCATCNLAKGNRDDPGKPIKPNRRGEKKPAPGMPPKGETPLLTAHLIDPNQ